MNDLGQLLAQLQRQRFYGSLEINLEGGRVVLLRKTETIKPTVVDYLNNRGNFNGTGNEG